MRTLVACETNDELNGGYLVTRYGVVQGKLEHVADAICDLVVRYGEQRCRLDHHFRVN